SPGSTIEGFPRRSWTPDQGRGEHTFSAGDGRGGTTTLPSPQPAGALRRRFLTVRTARGRGAITGQEGTRFVDRWTTATAASLVARRSAEFSPRRAIRNRSVLLWWCVPTRAARRRLPRSWRGAGGSPHARGRHGQWRSPRPSDVRGRAASNCIARTLAR